MLFNPKETRLDFGIIHISDFDPRGDLWDYYSETKLNWDDYTHYSYACLPENWEIEFTDRYDHLVDKE